MSKILIIGVGGPGANTVKRMKGVGIPNADFITFGGYIDEISDIPHYNLITMNGYDSISNAGTAQEWKELAENAKDEIGEIIESYLNQE